MDGNTRWGMLNDMSPHDRELFLIQWEAESDKRRMASLVTQYRQTNEYIKSTEALARLAVADYNISNADEDLERVELYADIIETYSWYKRELREEIREVREHIRWLRVQYRQEMTS